MYIILYFYLLTIAKYVLQDVSGQDSCYLCISLWENTNRADSQRSVFYLDEGTFVFIFSFIVEKLYEQDEHWKDTYCVCVILTNICVTI